MMESHFGIVNRDRFRISVLPIGSSVSLVTTSFDVKRFGFTASAVFSFSDTPATFLVCFNRKHGAYTACLRPKVYDTLIYQRWGVQL